MRKLYEEETDLSGDINPITEPESRNVIRRALVKLLASTSDPSIRNNVTQFCDKLNHAPVKDDAGVKKLLQDIV